MQNFLGYIAYEGPSQIDGAPMRVESYTHTGRNVTAVTLPDAPRFKRIVCICTDAPAMRASAPAALRTARNTRPRVVKMLRVMLSFPFLLLKSIL